MPMLLIHPISTSSYTMLHLKKIINIISNTEPMICSYMVIFSFRTNEVFHITLYIVPILASIVLHALYLLPTNGHSIVPILT